MRNLCVAFITCVAIGYLFASFQIVSSLKIGTILFILFFLNVQGTGLGLIEEIEINEI